MSHRLPFTLHSVLGILSFCILASVNVGVAESVHSAAIVPSPPSFVPLDFPTSATPGPSLYPATESPIVLDSTLTPSPSETATPTIVPDEYVEDEFCGLDTVSTEEEEFESTFDESEMTALGLMTVSDGPSFPIPSDLSYSWHRKLSIDALESAYKVTLYWAQTPAHYQIMRERLTRTVGSVWEEREMPTAATFSYAANRLLCFKYAPAPNYQTHRNRILYVRKLIQRLEAYARMLSLV